MFLKHDEVLFSNQMKYSNKILFEFYIKPSIQVATDCIVPSQDQSQVSATGAYTCCNDLQRN